jgi:hypothetical protein
MDTLGVRYIINREENPKGDKTFHPDRFTRIWKKDSWELFENTKASKRAFLSSDVLYYNGKDDFERIFFSDAFIPGKTILLESHHKQHFADILPGEGNVTLRRYTENTVKFDVSATFPSVLFLSDTYDSGWNAYIDSKKIPVYRATYAFRAVKIPTGNHSVVFSYEPQSFTTGLRIGVGTFIGLSGYLVFALIKRKRSVV